MRTVLRNAHIFDDGQISAARGSVLVDEGRIVDVVIGSDIAAGEGDDVVDLGGATLLPGLTLGHWHPEYPNLQLHQLNDCYLGQQRPPSYLAAVSVKNLENVLMSGFTSVVGAGCSHDIDVSMKMAIAEGVFDGPRIFACGHHIGTTGCDGDRAPWWLDMRPVHHGGTVVVGAETFSDSPGALRAAVREEIRRGVQVIKIFPTGGHGLDIVPGHRDLTRDELRLIVDTAHERGALVRGHVAGVDGIMECLDAGVDILDHCDGVDERCIERIVKQGTFVVPSMLFLKTLIDVAGGGFPPHMLKPVERDFEYMLGALPKLHAAGVRIVPGDDYGLAVIPHVRGIYAQDLKIHVDQAGIPALDVLRWVTVNGGALMQQPGELGRLKKGYLSDLIAVRGDLSTSLDALTDPERNVTLIVTRGKVVKNIAARLAAPAGQERRQPELVK